MKIKGLVCTLVLVLAATTNNANAGDKADTAAALVKGLGQGVSGAIQAVGSTMTGIAKTLRNTHGSPTIGGNATVKASINGIGGIVNVGVNVAGAVDAKQSVAGILSGNVKNNAKVDVSINGVGGIVNVGVAVAGANATCQSVGTIGSPEC
ncbi:hypothetical protein CSW98_09585 [Vibrio sp. HA2012]|uniref:hypothetical protein n=1 Tax=Vibrio sp. HA2012 TaxID=1971595 RepID=UPI000C2C0693|nr:hypothetical protein [Vibrio sp. HA2012]PJC86453.1 hypothetical protein CSW98_09585 [Vibrio sp. HA2012]